MTAFGLARVLRLQGKESLARTLAEESLTLFRAMQHEQEERVAVWLHRDDEADE